MVVSFMSCRWSVDCCIKLVYEAAVKVVGGEKRHQHIFSVVEYRRLRVACDTKRDFKYKNKNT
jgi:hypothetical protein